MLSDVSLPWRVVSGTNCESVYVLDADDDVCIRLHRENTVMAKHIANCVNAFAGYAPAILDAMVRNGFTVEELSQRAGAMERRLEESLPVRYPNFGASMAAARQACIASDSEGGHCD